MKRFSVLFFFLLFIFNFSQKILTVDEFGVLTDSTDIKTLHQEFTVIGIFEKISPNSEIRFARVLKEGKTGTPFWGYIDLQKKEIIPPQYLSVSTFENGHVLVKENIETKTKYNCGSANPCIRKEIKPYYYFVDANNNQVSDYFESVEKDESGEFYECKIRGTKKILEASSLKVLVNLKEGFGIDILPKGSDYRFKFRRRNSEDFMDEDGKFITNFKYQSLDSKNGFLYGANFGVKSTKYTLINPYTQSPYQNTLKFEYVLQGTKDKTRLIVSDEGKYFMIDREGFVKSKKYNSLKIIDENILFSSDESVGLLNKNGKEILKFKNVYSNSFPLRENVHTSIYLFERKDTEALDMLNLKKKKLYRTNAQSLRNWSQIISKYKRENETITEYFIAEDENNKVGILDSKGKIVVPYLYSYIDPVNNTGYFVATNTKGKAGVINISNEVLLPFTNEYNGYDEVHHLNLGKDKSKIESYYFDWKINNKVGIIDSKNNIIQPFEYDSFEHSEDFLIYRKNGKQGIMTKNGKVIPAEYDNDYLFYKNKVYYLFKDRELVGVDDDNNIVFRSDLAPRYPQFSEPESLDNKLLWIRDQSITYIWYPDGKPFMRLYYKDWIYSKGIGVSTDGFIFDIYKNKYEYYSSKDFNVEDFK